MAQLTQQGYYKVCMPIVCESNMMHGSTPEAAPARPELDQTRQFLCEDS